MKLMTRKFLHNEVVLGTIKLLESCGEEKFLGKLFGKMIVLLYLMKFENIFFFVAVMIRDHFDQYISFSLYQKI
ncbi:hypothetical protein ABID23_000636 [Bartonella silvatica]|uniref:Uncharacterized protein n=1 Tax=Bartonella silvatica TaxID=357760 RepID=A0ABV2HH88_9HYPH